MAKRSLNSALTGRQLWCRTCFTFPGPHCTSTTETPFKNKKRGFISPFSSKKPLLCCLMTKLSMKKFGHGRFWESSEMIILRKAASCSRLTMISLVNSAGMMVAIKRSIKIRQINSKICTNLYKMFTACHLVMAFFPLFKKGGYIYIAHMCAI